MISVAICEDDCLTLDILETMVNDYGLNNHVQMKIEKFAAGNMLVNSLDKYDPFDIFILDYYMPFMNGVELARKLRDAGEKGIIIFSTSSMDGVIDAFEVNTFRYLLKPVNKDVLDGVLDEAKNMISKGRAITHDIRTPDGIRKVRTDEIVFVEKYNRALCYHLFDGDEIISTTIQGSVKNAVSELLEKSGFVMAGSSVALNLNLIESVSRGDIFFCNGDEFTPPRREYTEIKNAWNSRLTA